MNIVLLGVLAVQSSTTSLQLIALAWITFFALFMLIRTWAVVGIWRSAGRHEDRGGQAGWAYFARFLLVAGILASLLQAKNYGMQALEYGQLAIGRDSIGEPATIEHVNSGAIKISGGITLGTADRFIEAANGMPSLQTVELESPGGRIFEAQRMADYVRKRSLDTRVVRNCESACTLVLLAGNERSADRIARVGFHQPAFPGLTEAQQIEAIRSNTKDYVDAGMDAQFVARVMATPAENMWYPDYDELIDAGVITADEITVGGSPAKDQLGLAIAESAHQTNRQAPVKIDEATELVGAEAEGHKLVINHRLMVDLAGSNVGAVRDEIDDGIKSSTCADATGKRIIEAGGQIIFRYRSKAGRRLFDVAVSECA